MLVAILSSKMNLASLTLLKIEIAICKASLEETAGFSAKWIFLPMSFGIAFFDLHAVVCKKKSILHPCIEDLWEESRVEGPKPCVLEVCQ